MHNTVSVTRFGTCILKKEESKSEEGQLISVWYFSAKFIFTVGPIDLFLVDSIGSGSVVCISNL